MLEIVLRDGKNELCINYSDGTIGFIVLTEGDNQIDFILEEKEWKEFKSFIDGQINKPIMRDIKK